MIDIDLNIRRRSSFWDGVSPDAVKRYREELTKLNEELRGGYMLERILLVSDDILKRIKENIELDLKYCDFYDEFQERLKEPHFGKWVFRKQEDIPDLYGLKKAPGEQWTKTNGRIKATIQFDRSTTMVKITLEYDNDSRSLRFYERGYRHKTPIFHVKSESSIAEKVRIFKRDADDYLNANLYPYGEYSEFRVLNDLLHIPERG